MLANSQILEVALDNSARERDSMQSASFDNETQSSLERNGKIETMLEMSDPQFLLNFPILELVQDFLQADSYPSLETGWNDIVGRMAKCLQFVNIIKKLAD